MNKCPYCIREFSNLGGLGAHHPYCKSNPNRKQRPKSPNAHVKKGNIPWNKGLTKEMDARMAKPHLIGRKWGSSLNGHSDETKARLSIVAKERKLGGYVRGSGRGKKGWYQNFFCDSSWELAYIIYCLDHNIKIERNIEKRKYEWNGKVKNYIPDFIVENKLVEIKGFKTTEWEAKLKSNPDVTVLYESDLHPILNYVIDKYGKDYIKLYE